ncbi:MAG: DUF2905 domain-containing protein [Candidatus Cloacimonetes bacterium]|nr:DUF2905 domain-containing protein [Candidatus Cloacimonadota bacterium]
MINIGKILILTGVILIIAGIILTQFQFAKFPGRLPGDLYIKKGNFTFYFPWVTCLLASIIITIIVRFLGRK